MKIRVDGRVHVPTAGLEKELVEHLKAKCTHENPAKKKWLRHQKGYPPKDFIRSWAREPGGISLPRGRLDEACDLLERWVDRVDIDWYVVGVPEERFEWPGPAPWDFQSRLVKSYLDGGPYIWRSEPGSGKTETCLQLFAALGQRTLVVAPNDAVFEQWRSRAERYFGWSPGVVKGKAWDLDKPLVIASQRSLWTNLELTASALGPRFGFVIFDEAQLCGARTYQEVLDLFPARYRLAVSGDEHRADGLECLVYDQFGPDVEEVSREELLEKGTLVDVEVRVVLSKFAAPWYTDVEIEKGEDGSAYGRRLAQAHFEGRHRLLAEMAADDARNELVRATAARCLGEGEQVVVMSRVREHCLRLEAIFEARGVSTVRLMGEDRDFERQREKFARGEARVAVGTYGKVGVGFESHREIARGILALPVASQDEGKMQVRQFAGRFARAAPGKSRSELVYVHDPLVFGDKPVRLLAKWFARVVVEDAGELVPAASWLKRNRKKHAKSTPTKPRDPGLSAESFARLGKQRGFWEE